MIRPVRVVVVAYHAPDLLDDCLAALLPTFEITVVDNSSSRDVRTIADERGAVYVDPGRNLGFAAGVNVALRRLLDGPPCDVLLVNPDARIAPATVEALAAFLHRPGHERLAAVAPRLVYADGTEQLVYWPFPTPIRAWGEALGLRRLLTGEPGFAIGAVLLLRWEAIQEIGLFDERFFLYAEEADWQRRAHTAGWSTGICSTAVAQHVGGGASSDRRSRESLFHAAHEGYVRKWHGSVGWGLFRAAAIVGGLLRTIVLPGDRRAEAARRTLLYVRGPERSALALRR